MFTIRTIIKSDLEMLFTMMGALASHESETEYLVTSPERLAKTGFGDHPQWRGFIAEEGGLPLGYTTYTEGFHIWSNRREINLDDLFVREGARGKGVGEALMARVFALVENEDAFVSWMVQPGNDRALAFYKKLGVKIETLGKCYWGL